jgi:hypothetical protein
LPVHASASGVGWVYIDLRFDWLEVEMRLNELFTEVEIQGIVGNTQKSLTFLDGLNLLKRISGSYPLSCKINNVCLEGIGIDDISELISEIKSRTGLAPAR